MHDYTSVLALLHAHAAEQRSGALLLDSTAVKHRTTERTLRNRARFICERMLELPDDERDQFAERAIRHL